MNVTFKKFLTGLALAACSIGTVQAAVFTENFEGAFPAWESNWFGTMSSARNYYCNGALGCGDRGNNPDGLWFANASMTFDDTFGASLTSFKLDVAGYSATTLTAYDNDANLIFNQNVALTFGGQIDPGVYSSYTINSTNGISRFEFSGTATGNTSIDNLVAITNDVAEGTVPEPSTVALLGLGLLGFAVSRRKAAKK